MSPNLQRYLRSISASHPNSGAASQTRPPVPAPHRHPAPIPPAATIIGKSLSATLIGTPFSHYHWHTTISHDHWHPIPGTSGHHARRQYISLFYYPTGTIGSSGTDRPPRGSSCTASQKTIRYGIIKPRDGITEDYQAARRHHQVARRHPRRPSRTASTKSIRQKALSRRGS